MRGFETVREMSANAGVGLHRHVVAIVSESIWPGLWLGKFDGQQIVIGTVKVEGQMTLPFRVLPV